MILILLFPFFNSWIFTLQEPSFQLNAFVSCEASSIVTDNMGNVYAISAFEIKKYNSKGELLKTFSNKTNGEISFVDVSNPHTVLVFYRDFNQILFLDNMLSPIGDVYSLIENNLDQVSIACSSRDKGIWLFDQQKFQLLRMDKNFQIIQQSGFINQLSGHEIRPNSMLEYNNQLYVNDPEVGIMVFDNFGAYYKTLPFKKVKMFQIAGDQLIYFSELSLQFYNLKTLEEDEMKLPEPNASSVRLEGNSLYILANDHISFYNVTH